MTKSGQINVAARDRSTDPFNKSSWSKTLTKPLGIGKKSSYFSSGSYLAESYGSSSSYGSLNDDEETFIKRLTPPDLHVDNRNH